MKLRVMYIATAAALLALSSASFAQTQSGSSIRGGSSDATASGSASGSQSVPPGFITPPLAPSTGTSADSAGAAGTTSPRSPDTSVGISGATGGATSAGTTTGRCDTLLGDERQKCLREQASTGTTGAGSTGMGSGTAK
jgi:hypothetical protein